MYSSFYRFLSKERMPEKVARGQDKKKKKICVTFDAHGQNGKHGDKFNHRTRRA